MSSCQQLEKYAGTFLTQFGSDLKVNVPTNRQSKRHCDYVTPEVDVYSTRAQMLLLTVRVAVALPA